MPAVAREGFTEVEAKLLRLGLDAAAAPGEIANASVMLMQSLRRRGMRPEALIAGMPSRLDTPLERARRLKMPFGRHRGRRLDVIEPAYLQWALRECSGLSLDLREAIRLVLGVGSVPKT
jgi:hypothetical protein